MSSRCRELVVITCALLSAGCERETRLFSDPGGDQLAAAAVEAAAGARESPYDYNAFNISEGQRLYEWFNCSGCHGKGGGGAMGPALMDDVWIYGGAAGQIYGSIALGRPNGMPAFGTRITRQQAWQLVAYVHALSGHVSKDAAPGRSDSIQVRHSPQSTPRKTEP